MRIGFALNLHWAIRLLNRFESEFSVDAPLVIVVCAITWRMYHTLYHSLTHCCICTVLVLLSAHVQLQVWFSVVVFTVVVDGI